MGGGKREAKRSGLGNSTLGKSLVRTRFNKQTLDKRDETGFVHTTNMDDGYDWARLQSVTEQGDLDAFLSTAELAGTEFTAEKLNVTISTGPSNTAVVSAEKARQIVEAELKYRDALRVPRRPSWIPGETTADELQKRERETFLEWRRGLILLQEHEHLTLTPFEKNLEVWRQLWRVVERSHVVVQIVDARNPLLFFCEDLCAYVKEISPDKTNVVLVNKADMLSEEQRRIWAEYFVRNGLRFVFWSAVLEQARLEREEKRMALEKAREALKEQRRQLGFQDEDEDDEEEEEVEEEECDDDYEDADGDDDAPTQRTVDSTTTTTTSSGKKLPWDILTKPELFDMLRNLCPDDLSVGMVAKWTAREPTIGLVGFPNVGKSSTINALSDGKKVAVSATPGRTKHFQTIVVDGLCLCDCPGLVFPSFLTTKADMVCSGMLPIDQLREFVGPATLIAARIPRMILNRTYGISIIEPADYDDKNRPPSGHELLYALGIKRGFLAANGRPDEGKTCRVLLKDYVNGRLLFCSPPPGLDPYDFNVASFAMQMNSTVDAVAADIDRERLASEKKVSKRVAKARDDAIFLSRMEGPTHNPKYVSGVDAEFFEQKKPVKAIFVRPPMATQTGSGPTPTPEEMMKKHKKRSRREKKRTGNLPGL